MAITSAICSSFKQQILVEGHNLTNGADSIKLALYTSSATLGAGTTVYVTTGNKAICAIDFGGDKTSTAGDFTVVFPSATATGAIIRLA